MSAPAKHPKRDELLTALHNVIASAPESERNILSQSLEDFAYTYSRSYRDLYSKGLISDVLETLEEAAECRINRDATGTPVREVQPTHRREKMSVMNAKSVKQFVTNLTDHAENSLAKFQENLKTNPKYAFEWGAGAMEAAAQQHVAAYITEWFKRSEDEETAAAHIISFATQETFRLASSTSQSTLVTSNEMERYTMSVWAQLASKAFDKVRFSGENVTVVFTGQVPPHRSRGEPQMRTYQKARKSLLQSISYYRVQLREVRKDPNSHLSSLWRERLTKLQERLAALRSNYIENSQERK